MSHEQGRSPDTHERDSFFGAAKIMAGLTMLSRVAGLVRDNVILRLGADRLTDSFWTAFAIPNLFRRLFGEGALSAAFVPVFTEVAETSGWDRARVVLANAFGLLAVVLAGLLLLVELAVGAGALWAALRPGGDDRLLLLQLVMLVMPFMLTVCLLALGSAALQCRGRFAYPAFAPILLNLAMIAAALAIRGWSTEATWQGMFALSGAVVVAGVLQLAGVLWLLRRVGLAAAPNLRPLLPEVRRVARLTVPMMVPLSILQFSAFFDQFYAWWMTATPERPTLTILGVTIQRPLEPGVVTCLYGANRIYQFPMGILAISLATAVFPLFSRYASRGDTEGLRGAVNRSLRLSLFLGIPSGLALVLLGREMVRVIFGYGRFGAEDVARTQFMLQMYALGMWAYFCNHILLRAFFAQKDSRTPLLMSCGLSGLNILLVATLIFTPLTYGAIGLATAITASLNTAGLTWVLKRRWGRIGGRAVAVSTLRTLAGAGAMAGAIVASRWAAAALWTGPVASTARTATILTVCMVAGSAAFLAVTRLLGASEISELLGGRRGRGGG